MSAWWRIREEVAGAWRSVRYDLGRRDAHGARDGDGWDTFDRPPRRLLAASAFVALALAGGVGSYLAVVDGLGPLLADPPRPGRLPVVAEAAPPSPATSRPVPAARLSHGTPLPSGTAARRTGVPVGAVVPMRPRPAAASTPSPPARARPRMTTPPTTGTPPESTRTPPVPRPSSHGGSPSGGATGSPSGRPSTSRSPSAPATRSPSPSASRFPSPSVMRSPSLSRSPSKSASRSPGRSPGTPVGVPAGRYL